MAAAHEHLWFRRFAWFALFYCVIVVLWGAYVRATYSGDGCGGHWPLCNGEVVPTSPGGQTLIEYTHRLSSGLSLAIVAGLWLWSRRTFPNRHRARSLARLALVFLIVEALLGAGLVVFSFVARNASAGRAVYLSLHLANTLILLAMLAATAWAAGRDTAWPGWRAVPGRLKTALGVAMAMSVTGAIAALGDTLFPATSLVAGIRAESAEGAHALLRLRVLHPAAAVAGALWLIWMAAERTRASGHTPVRHAALTVAGLSAIQLAAGAVNVALLAPVWMQITHLLLADLVWIALVLLLLESTSVDRKPAAAAPHG